MKILSFIATVLQFVCVLSEDGWFWHVTDFHFDPTYLGNAISCERNDTVRGVFGSNWCDSPWKLVMSSITAMYKHKADVDFVIWTGDSTPHVKDDLTSHALYEDIVSNITSALKATFPSTPVYPVFGNHDYYPANQFPPHNNLMYNEIYKEWKDWINNSTQKDNFLKGAYYTIKTAHGLRIMALNTNLYYKSDKVSQRYRYADPSDQFLWMADTLEHAKNNNEKVLIISHVPPGVKAEDSLSWMYPQFNHRFNEIILEYSDVISGLYFGHEHIDNFRLYYKNDSPVLVKLCAPSVTPWTYIRPNGEAEPTRNPGIRLIRYNRNSGQPLEILQYHLDLEKSNRVQSANWTVEYSLPKDYNMNDLSPQSFHKLIEQMKHRGSHVFSDYAKRRYINGANTDHRVTSCVSDACKMPFICSLKYPDITAYNICVGAQTPFGRK